MSIQEFAKEPSEKSLFWSSATKYASSTKQDESFVNEIAYMMVTLHKTGA